MYGPWKPWTAQGPSSPRFNFQHALSKVIKFRQHEVPKGIGSLVQLAATTTTTALLSSTHAFNRLCHLQH
jgi:hypothetical protein